MPPAAAGIGMSGPAKAVVWLMGVTSFTAKLLFATEW